MRYPIHGVNTTMLNAYPTPPDVTTYQDSPITATAVCGGVYAYGKRVTTGRTFWLRGISFVNASTLAVIDVLDGTEATTCAIANRRITLTAASGLSMSTRTTTTYKFAAPGIKFTTGCCVARDGTAMGAATTLWGAGTVIVYGYEEG